MTAVDLSAAEKVTASDSGIAHHTRSPRRWPVWKSLLLLIGASAALWAAVVAALVAIF